MSLKDKAMINVTKILQNNLWRSDAIYEVNCLATELLSGIKILHLN